MAGMAGMANTPTGNLQEKLDALPGKHDLYLMKYAGGTVLYGGRVVNLRAGPGWPLRERASTRLR